MGLIRWLHLVAAATWLGGLITLGAIVPTLRKEGVGQSQLQAMARRFSVLAWAAMAVAVVTGLLIVISVSGALRDAAFLGKLVLKVTLVSVAAGFAYWHQNSAREAQPRVRGAIQSVILAASLAIFAVAVAL